MDINWSKSKVEIKNEEGSISPFLAESTRSLSTQNTKMGNSRKIRCLKNFQTAVSQTRQAETQRLVVFIDSHRNE